MVQKKWLWIVLAGLALTGGGYFAYATWFAPPKNVAGETVLETAVVTTGDLSITADGVGNLVPASEIALSFSSNDTLTELFVEVGDRVKAGDVLASIDPTAAQNALIDAELKVIAAEQALDQAELQAAIAVAQAATDLALAEDELEATLNWQPDEDEIKVAQANLYSAQSSYRNVADRADLSDEQLASVRIKLEQATSSLASAQENYVSAMNPERDWERNIESTRENAAASLLRAQQDMEIAQANYDLAAIDSSTADKQSAWVKVLNAQSSLDAVESEPTEEEIAAANIKVQQMELAQQQATAAEQTAAREAELVLQQAQLTLEQAQQAYETTQLIAPFDGTITEINATLGEKVSGSAISMANLETPLVQFWVEESDLNSVSAGNPVHIVFDALPDLTYSGEILRFDPVLVSVSNTPAVQAWASINVQEHPVNLLGDMNVEVEIVAGEANNALLVPVQALRELAPEQYAVFVVQDSGELELRLVEVGLMDFVNAEIISGLQRGEVVSLGETTTSSSTETTSTSTNINTNINNRMMGIPGG